MGRRVGIILRHAELTEFAQRPDDLLLPGARPLRGRVRLQRGMREREARSGNAGLRGIEDVTKALLDRDGDYGLGTRFQFPHLRLLVLDRKSTRLNSSH